MSNGVLTSNGDSVLGSHHGDLIEQGILDSPFDFLDLLYGLIVVESVEKEVDIRGRAKLLVVVLAKLTLGSVELFGDREKTVDN